MQRRGNSEILQGMPNEEVGRILKKMMAESPSLAYSYHELLAKIIGKDEKDTPEESKEIPTAEKKGYAYLRSVIVKAGLPESVRQDILLGIMENLIFLELDPVKVKKINGLIAYYLNERSDRPAQASLDLPEYQLVMAIFKEAQTYQRETWILELISDLEGVFFDAEVTDEIYRTVEIYLTEYNQATATHE